MKYKYVQNKLSLEWVSKFLASSLIQIYLVYKAYNFTKEETLALAFSCEFCEISKNTFLQKASGGCFCITKECMTFVF